MIGQETLGWKAISDPFELRESHLIVGCRHVEAELTEGVRAPAIQLATADAAGVQIADGDVTPIGVGSDCCRQVAVFGSAVANLAVLLVAPTVQAAGLDGAAALATTINAGPA